MTIIIYTKPECVQCHATCRALDKKGISYQLVDLGLAANGQALAHVKALGYRQVPVVQTPSEHWSGFRLDKINLLAAALAS
ncbi:glutaredoxin-like protein NrdH [Acerihabitans sp.]|uniref:glutaredoxin-like protein NrdH n=1 Tax=Acerihabitans sp. TaxID=2811394 RepID=UPI002EDB1A00